MDQHTFIVDPLSATQSGHSFVNAQYFDHDSRASLHFFPISSSVIMSATGVDAQSIERIPPALLQTLPTKAPPPGILSNFVNPPTLVPAVLGVGTAFLILALICFSLRAWTKLAINKRCSWDDCKYPCVQDLLV